jgi:hypothetical protein
MTRAETSERSGLVLADINISPNSGGLPGISASQRILLHEAEAS